MRAGSVYAAPAMAGWRVYGMDLAWPPPALLPLGEAAVTALTVTPEGEVWAATSGEAAHLLWMPRPFEVVDAGRLPGIRDVAGQLVFDHRGRLFGAGRGSGEELFSCDTRMRVGSIYYSVGEPPALHGPVFADEGVACLAISANGRLIAALAEGSGRVALIDPDRPGEGAQLVVEVAERVSRVLAAGPDGAFHGLDGEGRLCRVSAAGDIRRIGESSTGGAAATGLTVLADGNLAVGTADGRLFLVDPVTGAATDCGRPNWSPYLRSLFEAGDGVLYGVTGDVGDLSRLVRWRPVSAAWEDLGLVHSAHHFPWTAFHIGPLATGAYGELVAGECDRFGHIFIMRPPAPG